MEQGKLLPTGARTAAARGSRLLLIQKIFVGTLQMAGGQGATQLLNFARNLLIARLIGPEQFGLGLTCLLVVAFVEMASDFSWHRFIVQDEQGEAPSLQATLHTFLLVRGVILAAALLFGAGFLTQVLGVPSELQWTYQVLAVVPLLVGMTHLDVKRFQRRLRYGPDVASQCIGNLSGLLVGVAAAVMLGDYRSMLAAVVVRYTVATLVTHLVAERPYRIGYDRAIAHRAWRFGWPLLVNGSLLFASSQGDRAVIVRTFGVAVFGVYGAVALVTQAVASLIVNVIGNLGLPILAAHQRSRADYITAYNRMGSISALTAIIVCVPMFAVLPTLIPLLYGDGFTMPHMLVGVLIMVLMALIFRNWPTIAMLALGDSRIVMLENGSRISGIAFAVAAAYTGGSVLHVAGALMLGEFAATVTIFLLIKRFHNFPIEYAAMLFSIVLAVGISCLLVEYWWERNLVVSFTAYPLILVAGLVSLYLASSEVRSLARDLRAIAQRQVPTQDPLRSESL